MVQEFEPNLIPHNILNKPLYSFRAFSISVTLYVDYTEYIRLSIHFIEYMHIREKYWKLTLL